MNQATLYIGGVKFGLTLLLARTPLYLRFVYGSRDWTSLDALDQLDDEAKDSEDIIVAKAFRQGRMHIDRVVNGRRVGEWRTYVDYQPIDPQPQREQVELADDWRAWCEAEEKRLKEQAK